MQRVNASLPVVWEYAWDMNTRETKSVALNVFEHFRPDLPQSYRETDFVLLANIAPALQAHVLDQMKRPRFVIADTMDLWIETTRPDLDALLPRVDLLILNDSEARQLTKETSLIKAGGRPAIGSEIRGDKKGEHGASLGRMNSQRGAYPLKTSTILPGRGPFAGALPLSRSRKTYPTFADLRRAIIYGSVLASFKSKNLASTGYGRGG